MDGHDPARAFTLHEPDRLAAPILFNSPHSGDCYPAAFLAITRLDVNDLRRSADLFMADIAACGARRGLPLLEVHLPRSFIDMNREPLELDPKMFDGHLPRDVNAGSVRVTSGYGTIPRLVADSVPIYSGRIPASEALERIARYHAPYHAALGQRLAGMRQASGRAVLIDCHSMPSTSPAGAARLADVVLGDRHGVSCDPAIVACVENCFAALGFTVARNQPYAGGYITAHYGRPAAGVNVLQIEINRALYMDEATYAPHQGLDWIKAAFAQLAADLVALESRHAQTPWRAAAE